RQEKANPRRAVVDRDAHRAMRADPLPTVRLHRPAEPIAAAFVPDSVAAEPPADTDGGLKKTFATRGHGSFGCWGGPNGSTPPGPSQGRLRSRPAAMKRAAVAA